MKITRLWFVFAASLTALQPAQAGTFQCRLPDGYLDNWPVVKLGIANDGSKHWNGTKISDSDYEEYLSYAGRADLRPAFAVVPDKTTKYSVLLPVLLQLRDKKIPWIYLGMGDRKGFAISCLPFDQSAQMPSSTAQLVINSDGAMLLNGKPTNGRQFTQYIEDVRKGRLQLKFIVVPDREARFHDFAEIIRTLQQNKIKYVSLE